MCEGREEEEIGGVLLQGSCSTKIHTHTHTLTLSRALTLRFVTLRASSSAVKEVCSEPSLTRSSRREVNLSLALPICRPPPASPSVSISSVVPAAFSSVKMGSFTPATLSCRTLTVTSALSLWGASTTCLRKSPAAHIASLMQKVAPCISFATASFVCEGGREARLPKHVKEKWKVARVHTHTHKYAHSRIITHLLNVLQDAAKL